MAEKRASRRAKPPGVFGQPPKQAQTKLRVGLYARVSTHDQQTIPLRVRAGLAQARQNGRRLGRPVTAALHADQVRKLHRASVSKAEIARRLQIGRTSVRRILAAKEL